jgi:uncharacterized membrane-anchored protein
MGFTMKTWELISIVLSALVAGMFHGAYTVLVQRFQGDRSRKRGSKTYSAAKAAVITASRLKPCP